MKKMIGKGENMKQQTLTPEETARILSDFDKKREVRG